jgi:heme exporter protein D
MSTPRDDGSALVEFVWLAVLLMIPLVYVVLTAVSLQRTAFAETTAAREAARAYATAGSDAEGERRAELVVAVAMRDGGVDWSAGGRRVVDCGRCTYAPGSSFTVELRSVVTLPFVPGWLCGHRCLAGVPVSARHRERVDCFGGTGPPPASGAC